MLCLCPYEDLKFVKKIFKKEIITPGVQIKGDKIMIKKESMEA